MQDSQSQILAFAFMKVLETVCAAPLQEAAHGEGRGR
jgi:hypothetical protein